MSYMSNQTDENDEKLKKCDACCKKFDPGDLTNVCGNDVCEDCLNNEYISCERCGEYSHNDDSYIIKNRHGHHEWVYCEDCKDNHVEKCEDCRDYFRRVDMIHIDGEGYYVCEHCYENNGYYQCADCDETFHGDNLHYIESIDHDVCNGCYDNYGSCYECSESYHNDDLVEFNGNYYCPDCLPEDIEIQAGDIRRTTVPIVIFVNTPEIRRIIDDPDSEL